MDLEATRLPDDVCRARVAARPIRYRYIPLAVSAVVASLTAPLLPLTCATKRRERRTNKILPTLPPFARPARIMAIKRAVRTFDTETISQVARPPTSPATADTDDTIRDATTTWPDDLRDALPPADYTVLDLDLSLGDVMPLSNKKQHHARLDDLFTEYGQGALKIARHRTRGFNRPTGTSKTPNSRTISDAPPLAPVLLCHRRNPCEALIDTGAAASIISEAAWLAVGAT
ncbi:Aste57867_24209 [Aphanomyces stellatus]|uniref:Aste57867_24209 protein n=1 Tax=Aphanomyces stellatus TaxID=120398 RepID=A0A485LPU2_9STRA|nr:hypothetical protein As57867_024134 [Aphanomyces stellatus]VFU00851.1 Aste57867_24209 [Aphanomyces stellatus]